MPDTYTLVARRGAEAYALEDLQPEFQGQVQGGVVLDFINSDKNIRFRTTLQFSEERLIFDDLSGIGFAPNRENQKQIENEIKILMMQRCIRTNGHLEVWDQETETILGRSQTCIPVNMFVDHEYYKKEIAELESLLQEMKRR